MRIYLTIMLFIFNNYFLIQILFFIFKLLHFFAFQIINYSLLIIFFNLILKSKLIFLIIKFLIFFVLKYL